MGSDEALAAAERRYRQLFEDASDAILLADDEGRYVDANAAASTLLGMPRERIIGMHVGALIPVEGPDAASRYEAYLRAGHETGEFHFRRPDGEVRLARYRAARIAPNLHQSVLRDVTNERAGELALRVAEERFRALLLNAPVAALVVGRDGRIRLANAAFERAHAAGRTDLTGQRLGEVTSPELAVVLGHVGDASLASTSRETLVGGFLVYTFALPAEEVGAFVVDLSHRLALEAQLRQAQKMDVVGRTAGALAHDFNNLLTVILGTAEHLRAQADVPGTARDELQGIVLAVKRAGTLTRQLLAFAGQRVVEPVRVDANAMLGSLETLFRRMLGDGCVVTFVLEPGLPAVHVDPIQIEQVLVNLLLNARDAMDGRGNVVIETQLRELAAGALPGPPEMAPGPYVVLSIADSGPGFSADMLARLFEPFATTKAAGKGTGLGLATSYGILRSHGGALTVDSKAGEGATVSLYLPAVAGGGSRPTRTEPRATLAEPRGAERVLVVDDEAQVRRFLTRTLTGLGYDVCEATDGVAALQLLEAPGQPLPSLVVTDVAMARMGGAQLARHIEERWPEIAVLFISGFTFDQVDTVAAGGRRRGFLQKPFDAAQLTRAVQGLLARTVTSR